MVDLRGVKILMKSKKCRKIINTVASFVIGIVFLSNIPALNSIRIYMILGASFLMAFDLVFGFIFLRCPHCKKLLNFRLSSQSICHNCGERLD